MPILCNEGFKYKIKIIGLSSSEVMRLEIIKQRLILHMTNPELEISTSVSSLLLRIQRVELIVTPFYGTFLRCHLIIKTTS